MQEIVNKLTEMLGGFLPEIDMSIKLGVIGGVIILLLFFISLGIGAGSKITVYRKKLIEATKFLNSQPPITEENVEIVYKEISTHPDEVKKGWSAFMDQRIGYPSDYITAKDVLSRREFSGKGAVAKVFLIALGVIVMAIVAVIGFMTDVEANSIMSAVIALEFVIIPFAIYIITILLLDIAFNRKIRRLGLAFESFVEMLDTKIVVSDKDEREFVSDNLDEINRRIEELIASRTGEEEVIEIITAPKVEEIEEVVVEQEPAVVEEEAVASVDTMEEAFVKEAEEEPAQVILSEMTEEEKENYFVLLIALVDKAIADEKCTDDDYALIASVIYEQAIKTGAMENPDDMAIFEECFKLLAEQIKN